MTVPDWPVQVWVAIVVPVGLAVLGGVVALIRKRRSAVPDLHFDPLDLFGPEDSPRPYPYAIGFRVVNLGGPAVQADFSCFDPGRLWYTEHVRIPVLFSGEAWIETAGIRGLKQEDDPSSDQASNFYHRCLAMIHCWDNLGRQWIFFPGRRYRVWPWRSPWRDPQHMIATSASFPSRGHERRATGQGGASPVPPKGE